MYNNRLGLHRFKDSYEEIKLSTYKHLTSSNLLYFDKELNIERYQCNRMASLFKIIDKNDNSIRYNDVSRCVEFIGDEFNNERSYSRDIYAFINNRFPITMPYYPSIEPYKVYIDKDTKKRYMIITPDGERIML